MLLLFNPPCCRSLPQGLLTFSKPLKQSELDTLGRVIVPVGISLKTTRDLENVHTCTWSLSLDSFDPELCDPYVWECLTSISSPERTSYSLGNMWITSLFERVDPPFLPGRLSAQGLPPVEPLDLVSKRLYLLHFLLTNHNVHGDDRPPSAVCKRWYKGCSSSFFKDLLAAVNGDPMVRLQPPRKLQAVVDVFDNGTFVLCCFKYAMHLFILVGPSLYVTPATCLAM